LILVSTGVGKAGVEVPLRSIGGAADRALPTSVEGRSACEDLLDRPEAEMDLLAIAARPLEAGLLFWAISGTA